MACAGHGLVHVAVVHGPLSWVACAHARIARPMCGSPCAVHVPLFHAHTPTRPPCIHPRTTSHIPSHSATAHTSPLPAIMHHAELWWSLLLLRTPPIIDRHASRRTLRRYAWSPGAAQHTYVYPQSYYTIHWPRMRDTIVLSMRDSLCCTPPTDPPPPPATALTPSTGHAGRLGCALCGDLQGCAVML